jgi:mannosyltransferase OCH1-like enzyme
MIKIIHQIWFNLGNGSNVPKKYKIYQDTWKKHHPKWKYILWDEKMGEVLMKDEYSDYYEIYKNVKYQIMKIDILRYCILHKYGGLYADIDYKCLNNFDNYIEENKTKNIFINETPKTYYSFIKKYVSNSLLISRKKKDKFWLFVMDECINRIKNQKNIYYIWYVMRTTGPMLLNDTIKYIKHNNQDMYNYIHILPSDQYNICNDCNKCSPSKTKILYAIHDYSSYWNDKKWLNIRKYISCLSIIDILLLIIVFYILYLLCFCNFRS